MCETGRLFKTHNLSYSQNPFIPIWSQTKCYCINLSSLVTETAVRNVQKCHMCNTPVSLVWHLSSIHGGLNIYRPPHVYYHRTCLYYVCIMTGHICTIYTLPQDISVQYIHYHRTYLYHIYITTEHVYTMSALPQNIYNTCLHNHRTYLYHVRITTEHIYTMSA